MVLERRMKREFQVDEQQEQKEGEEEPSMLGLYD